MSNHAVCACGGGWTFDFQQQRVYCRTCEEATTVNAGATPSEEGAPESAQDGLRRDLIRLQQERDALSAELAQVRALVCWCDDAARGQDVSEFALSFVPLQQVADLRASLLALTEAIRTLEGAWRKEADRLAMTTTLELGLAVKDMSRLKACADQLASLLTRAGRPVVLPPERATAPTDTKG